MAHKSGIIFTDISKLAKKFYGNDSYDSLSKAESLINDYILLRKQQNIEYTLVDVNREYAYRIALDQSWMKYRSMLNDYRDRHFRERKELITVLIIGGHDVIPVPAIKNFHEEKSADEYIYTDMPYSINYSGDFKNGGRRSYSWLTIKEILKAKPIFAISRIPLEEGRISTSALSNYYEKVKGYFGEGGTALNVRKLSYIAINITKNLSKNIVSAAKGNGIKIIGHLSPAMDIHKPEKREQLVRLSNNSDMMVFVLHGDPRQGKCGYFGQDVTRRTFLAAFSPSVLHQLPNIKMIAGLCCYGARFVNYDKEDSMLLSSMGDSSVISFMGSSNAVRGGFSKDGEVFHGEELLKLYISKVANGSYTGEALVKARYNLGISYFNRKDVFDRYDMHLLRTYLTTIFEFGIYGDPFLRIDIANSEISSENAFDEYFEKYSNIIVGNGDFNSTYENALRDSNISMYEALNDIDNAVSSRVSEYISKQYGIDTQYDEAYKLNSFGEEKYEFCYSNDYGEFSSKLYVFTDKSGNIESIEQTY